MKRITRYIFRFLLTILCILIQTCWAEATNDRANVGGIFDHSALSPQIMLNRAALEEYFNSETEEIIFGEAHRRTRSIIDSVLKHGINSASKLEDNGITVHASVDRYDGSDGSASISANLLQIDSRVTVNQLVTDALYHQAKGIVQVILERSSDTALNIVNSKRISDFYLQLLLEERAEHSIIALIDVAKLSPEDTQHIKENPFLETSGMALEIMLKHTVSKDAICGFLVPEAMLEIISDLLPSDKDIIIIPGKKQKNLSIARPALIHHRFSINLKRNVTIRVPDYEEALERFFSKNPKKYWLLHGIRLITPSDIIAESQPAAPLFYPGFTLQEQFPSAIEEIGLLQTFIPKTKPELPEQPHSLDHLLRYLLRPLLEQSI
ncbi:MAG: hypothetical protein V1747_05325 [Candidatus Omnitrophota bacterium]